MYLPPVIMPVNTTPDWFPLTAFQDIDWDSAATAGPPQWQYPQLEQTCMRIIGTIWCWISPATAWWSALTGRALMKCRIQKATQFAGLGSPVPTVQPGLTSLVHPSGGNVDFMWEHTEVFIAQSAWGDLTVDPTMAVRRIDVDVRVKRRLKQGECIALGLQYTGLDYGGDPVSFPDAFFDFELRTLLQTIT